MIDTVDSGAPVADVVTNVELPPQDDGIVYEGNKPLNKEPETEAKTEETPDSSEEAPKKENGWKRQRTRLKEQNQFVMSENEQLKARLAQLEGSATAQPVKNGEPKESDFESVLDYLKAHTEWTADEKLSSFQKKQQEEVEERQFAERLNVLEEREEAFSQQFPDYHEKVDALVETGLLTKDVLKAIVSSDISEQVAYHLTQYPQDAALMAQMGSNKQSLKQAIAQIEDFIEANPKTAVKQTKAAAPITPVQSKSANSTKNPSEMTVQELEAWRYGYRNKS